MNGGNLLLTRELVRDLENLLEDENKCSIDLIYSDYYIMLLVIYLISILGKYKTIEGLF
jgi:hypothetical protein